MSAHVDDWDHHWSEYADAASQNPAQAMRRRAIRALLRLGPAPARLLDIGCGQGDLLAEIGRHHPQAELWGVDYSQQGVDVAAAKVPGASFARCDLVVDEPRPPALAAWATHAVCSEVLEHVDDPETLLRNARALLAPGCRLVVTVPGGPMSAFDRHIGHRQHFTPDLLARLMRSAGYEVELATGAGFPMFNLYRMVVIARGERLAEDVASGEGAPASLPARAAMGVFRALLALPLPRTPWGWQVVGVARVPDSGAC